MKGILKFSTNSTSFVIVKYRALSDFEIHYPHPLEVEKGEIVSIGKRDATWSEWLWVSTSKEKVGAWIHESMLENPTATESEVVEGFSSKELSVKKSELVKSLRELGGWHWCEKSNGTCGWIPDYVLEKSE